MNDNGININESIQTTSSSREPDAGDRAVKQRQSSVMTLSKPSALEPLTSAPSRLSSANRARATLPHESYETIRHVKVGDGETETVTGLSRPNSRFDVIDRHTGNLTKTLKIVDVAGSTNEKVAITAAHYGLKGGQPINAKLEVEEPKDPEAKRKFSIFVHSLDPDSYEKRYSYLPRDFPEKYFEAQVSIFAYHEGKVIGVADFGKDLNSTNTATVNMVVHKDFQGKGVGKQLLEKRDEELRRRGYEFKSGSVYPDNKDQIQRLLKLGWEETKPDVDDDDGEIEMRNFRMKL